jgi:exocyst complex component 6
VQYLTEFVGSLENASMLQSTLDELQQTAALMAAESSEEFYDVSIRNKKYGRVNALTGPSLLEKYAAISAPDVWN